MRRPANFPRASARKEMETVGFEPTTPCLQSRCSPTELRPRGRRCPTAPPVRKKRHRSRDTALRGSATQVASLSLRGIEFQLRRNSMVGQGGLEPPTPRLSSVCSNQLSYWPRTRGVAQSGEGCAVGAHRSPCEPRPSEPARSGRPVRIPGTFDERPVRTIPTPSEAGQARTNARQVVYVRYIPRSPKAPSVRILERR